MAMILDASVPLLIEMLARLIRDEAAMILGVEDEIRKLQESLEDIRNVLEVAERVKERDKLLTSWLSRLSEVMYDADDLVDRCRIQGEKLRQELLGAPDSRSRSRRPRQVCFPVISCFRNAVFRHKMGSRIRKINGRIEDISRRKSQFHFADAVPGGQTNRLTRQTSPVIECDVVGEGIHRDTDSLVRTLVREDAQKPLVFAIVGMGGVGKTTLAQSIYDDDRIKANFPTRLWLCVSKEFSEINLLEEILGGTGGGRCDAHTRAQLEPLVQSAVAEKKFLLVLDDVWRAEIWENMLKNPLQSGAAGSGILVTTRDENIARQMEAARVHRVRELPSEEGWSLLCKKVFSSAEEAGDFGDLRDIGLQIVEKCDGLPLAIKTVGGVLRSKDRSRREWEKVLRSQAWSSAANLPEGIMGALYLSYEDLPSHLKQCFLYCSLFPENYIFVRTFIIQLWIAEGFVAAPGELAAEELAEDYYKELVKRSLLQPDPRYDSEKGCKMHSLTRFLAQHLSRGENLYENDSLQGLKSRAARVYRLSMASRAVASISAGNLDRNAPLRTLLLFDNPLIEAIPKDLIQKQKRLRVLDLMSTGIERLPDSIDRLEHLRYLNLSFCKLTRLPDTIGCLGSLQFLILQGCALLRRLPRSISRLRNLRALDLLHTPVECMPPGLGRMEHLSLLQGFVVNDGCHGLDELRSLSQLRILQIEKMENAAGGHKLVAGTLSGMPYLRELEVNCTVKPRGYLYGQEEVEMVEGIFEDLSPSPTAERLKLQGFSGRKWPTWMSASCLPNLTRLYLKDSPACTQLPALGRLPQLRHLLISGAPGVVAVGPELCGDGSPAFPRLEDMVLEDLPNLKEWTGLADGALPCLRGLHIEGCPSLRSLPSGLRHATALQELSIRGASAMTEVGGFPSVRSLYAVDNRSLERASYMPALQLLVAIDCPALRTVEAVGRLQRVYLTDHSMDALPRWIGGLPGELRALGLECGVQLLSQCLNGGPYWPMLEPIPFVYVVAEDRSAFVSYTRNPFSYCTNIKSAAAAGGEPRQATGDGTVAAAAAAAAAAFLSSSASSKSLDGGTAALSVLELGIDGSATPPVRRLIEWGKQ